MAQTGRTIVTIPDALRDAVALHGDRLLFREDGRSVTYSEFHRATNAVAHRLLETGDDRPLVVISPLGLSTIEVLHGAVKAGRLTVPLDPRWPRDQWLAVARDTGGRLVVPDDATRAELPASVADDALVATDLRGGEADDPSVDLDADGPAFMFFTSGSTGAPKGTVLTHAFVETALGLMRMKPGDRMAVVAPLSFITGALAAYGVPLTGASGHIADVGSTDPATIATWLRAEEMTTIGFGPTVVGMIARAALDGEGPIDSIQLIVEGGEVGTAEHFALARRAFPNAILVNAYGMTESGGAGCQYEIDPDDVSTSGALPIGRALPGVRMEIVDDDGQPVPDGVAGEIRITARRVALGYWNQPALTAERFSVGDDGVRSVRTGDRGRIRPDGVIEHLGRADRRVKVHGQLVDLGEVEHELERLPVVRRAVVSSVPTADGKQRVVAHVVVDDDRAVTVGELRRALAERIPPYAIPRAFFRVDDMPTAITGKVDRAWLRESAVGALPLETEHVAPRDHAERAVAALFEEVLAVERVGAHDDFFELGGDSLSAVDLLAGLAEELGLELTPGELLDRATVEGVAAHVSGGRATRARPVVPVNRAHGPRIFAVPGAAGTPLQYRALGRRLSGVELWSCTYRGIDHRALPDQSVRAIARRNVAALRELDPSGPYRLLGFSFGGAVALEMAHRLTASGEHVELLVLLEPSIGADLGSRLTQSRAFAGRAHDRAASAHPGRGAGARFARARELTRVAARYAARQAYLGSAGVVERRGLAQHDVFFELHGRIARGYEAEPFHGRSAVIASPQFFEQHRHVLDRVLPPESTGGGRHDVPLAAEHLDLVREPHVAVVARTLELLLAPDPR